MISDDTSTKSEPASTPASTPSETPSKPESSAPASYGRGEGQKPVSRAYRDNWNLIFGDKPKVSTKNATPKKAKAVSARKTRKPKAKSATTAKSARPKAAKKAKR
jgi:hypothetical protein